MKNEMSGKSYRMPRQPIENVVEWNFGVFATHFAASNHALRLLESCGVDQDDVLLFGCGIEEVARRTSQNNIAADSRAYAPSSLMPSFHKPLFKPTSGLIEQQP